MRVDFVFSKVTRGLLLLNLPKHQNPPKDGRVGGEEPVDFVPIGAGLLLHRILKLLLIQHPIMIKIILILVLHELGNLTLRLHGILKEEASSSIRMLRSKRQAISNLCQSALQGSRIPK